MSSTEGDAVTGGRVFFTNRNRNIVEEDQITLTSVGIDIGSSTSHLAFSRLRLERADSRFLVVERQLLFESEILLTPYAGRDEIDTEALKSFFDAQYALSGIGVDQIDTGALILTGTAVRRRNARAIGELFAGAAGKFVSVSAGDELEAVLAAFGSGAVALSQAGDAVMNIDIGGGTTKITQCRDGAVHAVTAVDIGARVIALDGDGRVTRLEPAGRWFAAKAGVTLELGDPACPADLERIADLMAQGVMETAGASALSADIRGLLRLNALDVTVPPRTIVFSGGVSEYIYARDARSYGDLGPLLARQIARRVADWGPVITPSVQGIRATVIGASQYTVQVSGSTIFVSDIGLLPLRNVPVIRPPIDLDAEDLDAAGIATAVRTALARLQDQGGATVALAYKWNGSATFRRMDAFCRGVAEGLSGRATDGRALVLVGEGDIGGLIGLHLAEEMKLPAPIVSVDGIFLNELDFVDIGELLEGSGSVPVVVKSLVFPGADLVGRGALDRL